MTSPTPDMGRSSLCSNTHVLYGGQCAMMHTHGAAQYPERYQKKRQRVFGGKMKNWFYIGKVFFLQINRPLLGYQIQGLGKCNAPARNSTPEKPGLIPNKKSHTCFFRFSKLSGCWSPAPALADLVNSSYLGEYYRSHFNSTPPDKNKHLEPFP